ncbi:hypothetical protein CDL15_Pgr022289 [Punica granatum]|uniref:Uncharacterized protein n=1 Tax=Punica granatum TaxID=22663 RepID=A0A218WNF3_PUNGR|nr:hypothetical protein CDL15_Pgr022289 [Punica granatum]
MTGQGLSYVAGGPGILVCLEKKVEYISHGNSARARVDITMRDDLPISLTVMMEDGQFIDVEVEYHILGNLRPK